MNIERFVRKSVNKGRKRLIPVAFLVLLNSMFLTTMLLLNTPIGADAEVYCAADLDSFFSGNHVYAVIHGGDCIYTGYSVEKQSSSQTFIIPMLPMGNELMEFELPSWAQSPATPVYIYALSYGGKHALYECPTTDTPCEPCGLLVMKGHILQFHYDVLLDMISTDTRISIGDLSQFVYPNMLYPGTTTLTMRRLNASMGVLVSIVAICAYIFLVRSRFSIRHSRLGAQIAQYGDFRALEALIDHQALTPVAMTSTFAVLKDYVLFKHKGVADVFMLINDITGASLAVDEALDETRYTITIEANGVSASTTTFDLEDATKALNHISYVTGIRYDAPDVPVSAV